MTTRVYDNSVYRYKVGSIMLWSNSTLSWEEQQPTPLPGVQINSMFEEGAYIGTGTVWQRDISSMPLDSLSSTKAAWMWNLSPTPYNTVNGGSSGAFGSRTSFNSSAYGTHPIVCCVVDSTDPNCRFQYVDTCAGPDMTTAETTAMLLGAIPWPTGLVPPSSGDKAIAFYDLGTGIMREYFGAAAVANKPGHWTATVGGYSVANPHFRSLATTNYATQFKGSSAVVKMHNTFGQVGISEVRMGKINHALGFTMANATGGAVTGGIPASWPALASDGKFPGSMWSGWSENGGGAGPYPGDSPRHGQWGKLPASVDPEYNSRTGLPFNPLTQLLIKAAKQYGLVGTDTNAWCHAFNGESGNREKLFTGIDPWAANGELATLLNPGTPSAAFDVSDFPWDLTQWAPADWGRPNPDFMLRGGEHFAYEPHTR